MYTYMGVLHVRITCMKWNVTIILQSIEYKDGVTET